ncbi:MAG TPA: pyrroline-5-carboxylate reductase dimerization domain-containing protein [Candidatus Acidoferrum sp.]|jgi:pyrroline-5-carboxylate reductase|nr:pyrroline-5-carboxylate reductase dimerization domain-containing protein [Candidatus Acidoferrum sp.]
MATVFLGGGRITAALLAGLRLANYRSPLVVHDRNPHKLRELQKEFSVMVEPNLMHAVARAQLLMIAVRPGDVAAILTEISEGESQGRRARRSRPALIACSLAAGIPFAKLRARLGAPVRWSRAMPSPVARTGNGLTSLTFDRRFPPSARKLVRDFFARVGAVLEVPERKFDAFMVTFSPSHGYHALATLAQAAEKLGLDRNTAFAAASHALADGIVSWRQGTESLEGLLHESATPGGIAAAVMNAMDDKGYSRTIERALRAGLARARKNAKL